MPDAPPEITDADWRRLHPASATPKTAAGALSGVVMSAVLAIATSAQLERLSIRIILVAVAMITGAFLGGVIGRARWRRTRWRLDESGFYVRRGWLWRTEVVIPRSRVQHLDLERGPIERYFGLASVVIHTAGTQTPALRQSGLAETDALALRDALIPSASRNDDAL